MSQLKDIDIKSKTIFKKTEVFNKYLKSAENDNSDTNIIQISNSMYEKLKSNKDKKVKITYKFKSEKIEVNNVIGKISGKNSKDAIVLSAHFDHVGKIGENVFCGAIDNASGVATLLEISNILKGEYKNAKPDKDIVICFFNGEDSNLQGSKGFIEDLKEKYGEIYNINLDCIGIKNDNKILITANDKFENPLKDDIEEFFKSENYKIDDKVENLTSDHITFLQNDIVAINIGQPNIEKIHTINDIKENIDLKFIEKISKDLVKFIDENIKNKYTLKLNMKQKMMIKEDDKDIEERFRRIEEESNKLNINEYKIVEYNGKREMYSRASIFLGETAWKKDGEVGDFKKYYNELNINERLNNMELRGVILSNYLGDISKIYQESELGKVYKKDLNTNNIERINLNYKKGNSYLDIILEIQRDGFYPENVELIETNEEKEINEKAYKVFKAQNEIEEENLIVRRQEKLDENKMAYVTIKTNDEMLISKEVESEVEKIINIIK